LETLRRSIFVPITCTVNRTLFPLILLLAYDSQLWAH